MRAIVSNLGIVSILSCLVAFSASAGELAVAPKPKKSKTGTFVLARAQYANFSYPPSELPANLPYLRSDLPKKGWVGLYYLRGEGLVSHQLCDILGDLDVKVRTSDEGDHVEVYTDTPFLDKHLYFFGGLGLSPGPYECGTQVSDGGFAFNTLTPYRGNGKYRFRSELIEIVPTVAAGQVTFELRIGKKSQRLFSMKADKSRLVMTLDIVGDIDRDKKPDVVASVGTFEYAKHIKVYLSSKAVAGELVGLAAGY
jgi:hypothetical protein